MKFVLSHALSFAAGSSPHPELLTNESTASGGFGLDDAGPKNAGISNTGQNTLQRATTTSTEEDLELIRKSSEGNRDAYRQLVEKYQKRAFGVAFEILRSKEDAEDVIQEAFVKAYLSLKEFRGHSSFYTWFYRIVCNMAIDLRRKVARRGGPAVVFEEVKDQQELSAPSGGFNPENTVFRKEQAASIQRAMEQLSDEHRSVVYLRELEGMNYDDIARVLKISKGTVMSRLHYARKKLQQLLAERAQEDLGAKPESAESERRSRLDGNGEASNAQDRNAKDSGAGIKHNLR